jgi:hypothetical protein
VAVPGDRVDRLDQELGGGPGDELARLVRTLARLVVCPLSGPEGRGFGPMAAAAALATLRASLTPIAWKDANR